MSLFLRRPHPGGSYSVERLFHSVVGVLPADRYDVRVLVCPWESVGLVRRLALIIWAACHQGDVNHITGDVNFLGLFMRRSRTLLTILDSASMWRLTGLRRYCYWFAWLRLPIWRAGLVTTISQTTLEETMSYVRADRAKFEVIPCCVPKGIMSEQSKPFCASQPRLLIVGTKQNKNLDRVIEALAGVRCRLVVVGELSEAHREHVSKHGVDVENYVRLDDESIALQYRNCDVVLFVSTYEGFGIPILEAQAAGRPVITSRRSPMREVAGSGSCLVDPESVHEIREAVLRVVGDPEYRAELVRAGSENVKAYSPENIARLYASTYEKLFSGIS